MTVWKLHHVDGSEEPIKTKGHLVQLLTKFQAQREDRPFVLDLEGPSGALGFGVGRPDTFLHHTPAGGLPPYMMSRGSGPPGNVLVYFYGGDWTEIDTEAAIPWTQAIGAILDYYETGNLSSAVDWAEV